MWWGNTPNHKTSLPLVKVHILVTTTGHPAVPPTFTVWMANTWEGEAQENGKGPQRLHKGARAST